VEQPARAQAPDVGLPAPTGYNQRAVKYKTGTRIKRSLTKNPAWQIVIGGTYWQCPFCGDAKLRWTNDESAMIERIAQHFEDLGCKGWNAGEGKELNLARLEELRELHETELTIERDPLWQVHDSKERWYCPYCGEPTPVRFHMDQGRVPTEVAQQIIRHTRTCKPRATPLSLDVLQNRAKHYDEYSKAREAVRHGWQTMPELWQVFDRSDRWLCPYCLEAAIPIAQRESLPEHELLERLAAHLAVCGKFTGAAPTISLEEMLRQVSRLNDKIDAFAVLRRDQMAVIPKKHPTVPGFDIYSEWHPAHEVAGDFFRYFDVAGGRIGLLLGDVSGHAAQGSIIPQIVQSFVENTPNTASALTTVRNVGRGVLRAGLRPVTFISLIYAVLDAKQRTLSLVRAGQNLPLLVNRKRKPAAVLITVPGMVLSVSTAALFESSLKEATLKLEPGDIVVLYTDGIPECKSPDDKAFGMERFSKAVLDSASLPAQEIARNVIEAVRKHRGQSHQQDDITLTVIKFTGEEAKGK